MALGTTCRSVSGLQHFLPEVFCIILPEQSRHRHQPFFFELVSDGFVDFVDIPNDGSFSFVDHDMNDPTAAVPREADVLEQTLRQLYIYTHIYIYIYHYVANEIFP